MPEGPAPGALVEPAPAAPPEPKPLKKVRRPVVIQWRSYVGWFALFWMCDLVWLALLAQHGVDVTDMAALKVYAVKTGAGLLAAGTLSFSLPIALLDESSHAARKWWIAWLWPPVLLSMLGTDCLIAAYVALPLMKLLHH
jgi:hypothetical protein